MFRIGIAVLVAAFVTTPGYAQQAGENTCAIARMKSCDISAAIKRGLVETGLRPVFPTDVACRGIDEHWAVSYDNKRDNPSFHGGIDMPAPYGTPILAAAAGEVVAVFRGTNSYRGIELILRHSPAQSGSRFWVFSGYSHFKTMPRLKVGDRVAIGQELGPTGNSGRGREPFRQSGKRRPAIHFSVVYSRTPDFKISKNQVVVPKDARWADPNAFVNGHISLDSFALRNFPAHRKKVPVGVMLTDGTVLPKGAKVVWPYACAG